jgi:transcriptional regulator with XRE-family HTH domain
MGAVKRYMDDLADSAGPKPLAAAARRGWEHSRAVGARNVVGGEGFVVGLAPAPTTAGSVAAADELTPEAARQQLGRVITAARVKAGKPLLVKLAREVGYSESMLSRVLNGRITPTRDRLESLAERLDVDTRTYAGVWVPLWTAASSKGKPKAEQAPGTSGLPTGFECPACGTWVVNPAKHIEWHMAPDIGNQGGSVTPLRSAK